MGVRRRLTAGARIAGGLLVLTVALVGGVACKDKAPPEEAPKPPDHLAPDEVAEGKERVFGLPLPRVARVETRFAKSVHVTSPLSPEALSNFVRQRVKEGAGAAGAASTTLENVVPRDDAGKRVTVEIRARKTGDGTKSEMVVRDVTPNATEPGLSDEERWRRAGLRPDGTVLDPTKLE